MKTECDFGGFIGWVTDSRFLCLRLAHPGRIALSLVQLDSDSSHRVARLGLESQSITISPGISRIAAFAGKTLRFYDARTLDPLFSTRRVAPRREGKSNTLVPLLWAPDGTAIAQAGLNVVAAHRVNANGVSRALAVLRPAPSVGWSGDSRRFLSCQRRFVGINKAGGVDVDLPQYERGSWSPNRQWSAWVPYGGFNQDNFVRVTLAHSGKLRTAMVTKYQPHVIGWSDDSRFLASSAHEPKEGAEWYPQPCEIVQPWAKDPNFKPGERVVVRTGNDPALIRVRAGNAAPVTREGKDGDILTLARGPLVVDGLRWWEFEEGGWLSDYDFKPGADGL